MKSIQPVILFCLCLLQCVPVFSQNQDSAVMARFFTTALKENKAYMDMYEICKKCGPRLSGSPGAEKAVLLTRELMRKAGADSVWLQEVMVPHWVRGEKEQAAISSSVLKMNQPVPVCALGGSIGTPKEGLTAQVVEVKGMGQLKNMKREDIAGKIVYYSDPFDQSHRHTFQAYGKCVTQRWGGAMEAAQYGAVGVVIRSMAQHADEWPHTGSMGYADTVKKIPAVAISSREGDLLSESLKKDKNLKFYFKTNCETLPDAQSYNVIGEIIGTEKPNEVIVVGGHLDSWDLSESAQDDAAGVVQSIEVLRLFKTLGIKPKRTIRAIAYMNEENGGKGGAKYAEWAKTSGEKHIAAIESDAGGFTPRGFSLDVKENLSAYIQLKWKPLLEKFEIGDLDNTGSGADVGHLKPICPLMAGLYVDTQRYFDFHHTGRDTWENCNDRELEMGGAAMASFVYLIDTYGIGE